MPPANRNGALAVAEEREDGGRQQRELAQRPDAAGQRLQLATAAPTAPGPGRVIGADPEKMPPSMPPLARITALALAVAGCVLLVVAEFSTLYEIRVITVVQETTDGRENHAYALLVIALAAGFMTFGGILAGARPAQWALLVLALAALFVVFAIDFPKVDEEGFIGDAFERAKATPQKGFYLESLGAVLLLIAAVATLLLSPRGERRSRVPAE